MPGNARTPIKVTVDKLGNVGNDGTWFDTSAFAWPTGVPVRQVGRNTRRAPGVVNTPAVSLLRSGMRLFRCQTSISRVRVKLFGFFEPASDVRYPRQRTMSLAIGNSAIGNPE